MNTLDESEIPKHLDKCSNRKAGRKAISSQNTKQQRYANRVQSMLSPGAKFPDKSFWGLATGILGVFIIISCWSWLLYITLEKWSMGFGKAKVVKASK